MIVEISAGMEGWIFGYIALKFQLHSKSVVGIVFKQAARLTKMNFSTKHDPSSLLVSTPRWITCNPSELSAMTRKNREKGSTFDMCCPGTGGEKPSPPSSPAQIPYNDSQQEGEQRSTLTDEMDDESYGPAPPPPDHPHPEDADGEVVGSDGYDEDNDDKMDEDIPDIERKGSDDPPAEQTLDLSDNEFDDDESVEIPPTNVVQRMMAQEKYGSSKETGDRSYGWLAGVCCCILVILAIVLGAGYGTGAFGENSSKSVAPTNPDGNQAPDGGDQNPEDTNVPPEDPEIPTNLGDLDRSEAVAAYLAAVNTNGENAFSDDQSVESSALNWLVTVDPLQLDPTVEADQFRLQQRYALLTVWFASAVQWNDETGWVADEDECQWYGVSCEARDLGGEIGTQNVVVVLNLVDNNLQGPLPADIALLDSATGLVLAGNTLQGGIPASIGTMSNLEELYLDRNEFQQDLSEYNFSGMSSLAVLWLSGNQFSGTLPTSVFSLQTLQFLILDDNEFTGGIDGLSGLPNLSKLRSTLLSSERLLQFTAF